MDIPLPDLSGKEDKEGKGLPASHVFAVLTLVLLISLGVNIYLLTQNTPGDIAGQLVLDRNVVLDDQTGELVDIDAEIDKLASNIDWGLITSDEQDALFPALGLESDDIVALREGQTGTISLSGASAGCGVDVCETYVAKHMSVYVTSLRERCAWTGRGNANRSSICTHLRNMFNESFWPARACLIAAGVSCQAR